MARPFRRALAFLGFWVGGSSISAAESAPRQPASLQNAIASLQGPSEPRQGALPADCWADPALAAVIASWCGSIASVMPGADEPAGVAMEPKPNPFLVASLMNSGGDQTHIQFTLATAVVLALVIFVIAFLFGLWCGWMWRRQHTRLEANADLKHRARA